MDFLPQVTYVAINFSPVLGFVPSVFTGVEQVQDFSVQAGYLSGRPPVGAVLFLQLIPETAGN